MAWKLYISDHARQEVHDIWHRGYERFGVRVADDYERLIAQALRDLMENPHRPGAKLVHGHKAPVYSYPLFHSNARAGGSIRHPRHAIYYFLIEEDTIAIASICRQERERHVQALHPDDILKEMHDGLEE